MQAIKIDPIKQEVSLVEIDGSLESIYKELDCTTFTCPSILDNMDSLYVDDEGLFVSEYKGAFYFNNFPQMLFGNGLLMGSDEEGESVDVKSTLEDVINKIKFIPESTGKYVLETFQTTGNTF